MISWISLLTFIHHPFLSTTKENISAWFFWALYSVYCVHKFKMLPWRFDFPSIGSSSGHNFLVWTFIVFAHSVEHLLLDLNWGLMRLGFVDYSWGWLRHTIITYCKIVMTGEKCCFLVNDNWSNYLFLHIFRAEYYFSQHFKIIQISQIYNKKTQFYFYLLSYFWFFIHQILACVFF